MDELNSLPYLDAVVREALRLYAPVPATMRAAAKDDIVPLSAPYTDKEGKKHDSIMYVYLGMLVQLLILSLILVESRKARTL